MAMRPYACSLPGQAEDYTSSKQWEQHGTNHCLARRTYTAQSQINNTISRISPHFDAKLATGQKFFKAGDLHRAEGAHFSIDLALVMASQIPCINCAIIASHDHSRTFRIFNHLGKKDAVAWDQSLRLFWTRNYSISESVHSYSFICMFAGGCKFQCYMQTTLKPKRPYVP